MIFLHFSKQTSKLDSLVNQMLHQLSLKVYIDHASKANFNQDMMFPKNDSIIVNETF